jgi:hypothetical protein
VSWLRPGNDEQDVKIRDLPSSPQLPEKDAGPSRLDAGRRWDLPSRSPSGRTTPSSASALVTERPGRSDTGSERQAWRRRSDSGIDYWLRADDSGIYRVATKTDLQEDPSPTRRRASC